MTVSVWIFFGSIGSRDVLLAWLNDSGAYDKITPALIDTIETSAAEERAGQVSGIDIEKLTAVSSEVYDGQFMRGQAEGAINGLFDWLDGVTAEPEFTLSLQSRSDEFRQALGQVLKDEINQLPTCSQEEALQAFEAGRATCRPEGINIDGEVNRAIERVGISDNSEDSLLEDELTADDIFSGPIEINQQSVKDGYQGAATARIALPFIIMLISLTVFLTAKTHRRGTQLISSAFLSVGITTILGGVAFSLSRLLQDSVRDGDNQQIFEDVLLPITEQITETVARLSYIYGGIIVVIALILWAVAHWVFKKPNTQVVENDETINLAANDLPYEQDENNQSYINDLTNEQQAVQPQKPTKKQVEARPQTSSSPQRQTATQPAKKPPRK